METDDYRFIIYRSKRKNLRLTLRSDGTLALYCPTRFPQKKAEEFIRLNAEKLIAYGKERDSELLDFLFGNKTTPSLPYFGQRIRVFFDGSEKFNFDGQVFHCPAFETFEECKNHYKEFLRNEAKRYIPPMVSNVAAVNGLSYNQVHIKDISSRWGSCSSAKNLNFSLALIACDRNFIRAVISHELAHIIHMDHSEAFYETVHKICPRYTDYHDRHKQQYSKILKCICSK